MDNFTKSNLIKIQTLLLISLGLYLPPIQGVEPVSEPRNPQAIIGLNSEWQYQLDPTDPPSDFSKTTYDSSAWKSGKSGFGYGDDDDATVLEMRNKSKLAIRHHFELSDGEDPSQLYLAIRYDDAFELWINGHRFFAKGIERKDGKIQIKSHEAKEWEYFPLSSFADRLDPTRNCIALIGYNTSKNSSDFTLDPQLLTGSAPPPPSRMNKFRVVWWSDPTSEATIVWNQQTGTPGEVHYGKTTPQNGESVLDIVQKPQRIVDQAPMNTCIAHLSKLEPDTEYAFYIKDSKETSRRLKFRTASKQSKPFTFIAGGDSRNGRKIRVEGNRIAEKLKPSFIAFTGDLVVTDTNQKWADWLDDWQAIISEDGTIIPIVPHRGNHEGRPTSIHDTFGAPKDAYYAFSIGENLFRYYALNSEIPAEGKQGDWLEKDLQNYKGQITHLVAGYHKPMRPHVSKKSEGSNPFRWADEFYEFGLDLAIESDSHVMKRTLPLKPDTAGDEGFSHSANDKNATIYIGEGCWGAPLRAADDGKDWTTAKASFNGFDWIHVTPEQIEIKTVRFSDAEKIGSVDPEAPFKTPEGLQLWEPAGGQVLIVPGDK